MRRSQSESFGLACLADLTEFEDVLNQSEYVTCSGDNSSYSEGSSQNMGDANARNSLPIVNLDTSL